MNFMQENAVYNAGEKKSLRMELVAMFVFN